MTVDQEATNTRVDLLYNSKQSAREQEDERVKQQRRGAEQEEGKPVGPHKSSFYFPIMLINGRDHKSQNNTSNPIDFIPLLQGKTLRRPPKRMI